MAGVKRTVRVGVMPYTDPDGRVLRADCDAEVLVHPDDVARFDALNVLPGDGDAPVAEPDGDAPVAEPKPRRRGTAKDESDAGA